ncbi:ATP-binding protein [Pseudodesulfovibrio sp.]|uniref:sensor histidine kinase n=1 Tax=Pseudodesulfovibrio sp. TaxID=2035812 RepID=UPI00261197A7|nr:ATP-binding protein [Pseudodesulfovibrio sp.]MDD3312872.1 ATP-binding protein [Pseudodesulfovibrio sp.]
MTLKKKILIGYGVVFALLGMVVAWSVTNLVSLGKASDAILSENYRSILAAENMIDALERQDSGILLLFLGDAAKGVSQFRDNEALFLEWFARAKDNITIPEEKGLIQAIEKDFSTYRRQFSSLTDQRSSQAAIPSLSMYQNDVHPFFLKVREDCVNLRHLNEETMYTASLKAGRLASYAFWSTVLVASAAFIIALAFSLMLSKRITRPLDRFVDAARRISSGDYAVKVPVESGDELGVLAEEFNRMAIQLGRFREMNIDQIISEKNKGEAILASIEDGLVVFDTALRATSLNTAARRILGLGLSESGAAPACAEILPEGQVRDLVRQAVETGRTPDIPNEHRVVTFEKGDRPSHYLFSVTVIRGRERTLSGVVLLLRDITRMKEIERLKNDFVMAASHELRTPLTSLGMSIDLLLEHVAQKLEEKDRDLLQAAHEEVQRMKALVSDLLDLSRIEAGRIELEFERVPVSTLFEHVQAVFKGQLERKAIRLVLNAPRINVRADANKVTWVLSNLVSNAMRYVNEGGAITLTASTAGPYAHLSVKDDGPGIPQEYQTKIFQKFIQVKGQDAGGTGLGLAICKEIVRAHGGSIWVESAAGSGSTFTFTLPVAQ